MSEDSGKFDGLIDEALRALTSGAPSDGLRRRVLARVAAEDEPAPRGLFGAFGWRVYAIRWATVVALGVLALTGALLVVGPAPQSPSATNQTAIVSIPVAPAAHAAVVANPRVRVVESAPMVNATARPLPGPVPIRRELPGLLPAAVDEQTDADAVVRIVLLSEPSPIADRPIEIAPLTIQPVANREIQIPLIETDRPQKGPGQTDKR